MTNDEGLSDEANNLGVTCEEILYTQCPDTGELIEYRLPAYEWCKPETIDTKEYPMLGMGDN